MPYNYDPYYDRYDGGDHKANNYTRVLAKPGFVEQAAEFNEIQSIARDYTERLGNALFSDGYIISGCAMHIDGTQVTIEPGRIFLGGLIRYYGGTGEYPLEISGVGRERIVASLETSIVTSTQDITLLDPAQGAENFGLEGADREVQNVVFRAVAVDESGESESDGNESENTNVDSGAVAVYELQSGEILNESQEDNNSYINSLLANRTYDSDGNFKIKGLSIMPNAEIVGDSTGTESILGIEYNTYDPTSVSLRVYISAGQAYVNGYKIVKPSMNTIQLDPAISGIDVNQSTKLVSRESKTYRGTVPTYRLNHGPISDIAYGDLSCIVETVVNNVQKGNNNGLDSIPNLSNNGSLYRIIDVYQGSTHYLNWTQEGEQIRWQSTYNGEAATQPNSGTSYSIKYQYEKVLSTETDCMVYNDPERNASYVCFAAPDPLGTYKYYDIDGNAIAVAPNTYVSPVSNTPISIRYSYNLARRDLIAIDQEGVIYVIKGTYAPDDQLITPQLDSKAAMALGYVDIYPFDEVSNVFRTKPVKVVSYDSVRLTQQDLFTLLLRLDRAEENIADLAIEKELTSGEDTTRLSGYFIDSFNDLSKADLNYSDGDIIFDACIDYDMNELTVPSTVYNRDLSISSTNSGSYGEYDRKDNDVIGRIISAPYVEEVLLQQMYATGTMLVNPYASYGPMCQVVLSPTVRNWVEERKIDVQGETQVYMVSGAAYNVVSHGYWSVNATKNLRNYLSSYVETTKTSSVDKTTKTTLSTNTTLIEYMKSGVPVKVRGRAFGANATKIFARFNNIPVSLTPNAVATNDMVATLSDGTKSINGKTVNCVKANANGSFDASFTVPAGVPCGSVNVVLEGLDSNNNPIYGEAVYTSNGTLRTLTYTHTEIITQRSFVLYTQHNLYKSDPLAQSFVADLNNDACISKISLYFATKDNYRPAIVQVRNMVNGYPGGDVYAEVTLKSEDVNLPVNGVPRETVVKLNQPVYCNAGEFYCFVILSDSNNYSMYYANLGDSLINTSTGAQTGERLVVNPYATGVLFSSSNASTWTAHQGADLMFKLWKTRFTGNTEIVFDSVRLTDKITGLMLDTIYQNNSKDADCTIKWYYSYVGDSGNNSNEWLPIDTLEYVDLRDMVSVVNIKAVLSTNYSTSPYIATDNITLNAFTDETTAHYISASLTRDDFGENNNDNLNLYQGLKISYKAHSAIENDITLYYMDDINGRWVKLEADIEPDGVDDEFIEPNVLDENGNPYTLGDVVHHGNANVAVHSYNIDGEFSQYTWDIKNIKSVVEGAVNETGCNGSNFFKIRIDFRNSGRVYNRPRVKDLAVVFKQEDILDDYSS